MYKVIGADGREYGPITAEQVRQWIRERRLNNQSLIQPPGETGWKPLSFFPDFANELALTTSIATPASTATTNNMAIASLVLGIASWVCCCNLGVFNILGIIFGFVALSQLKTRPDETGKPLAIIGIALSGAGLVMSILSISFGMLTHLFEMFRQWQ